MSEDKDIAYITKYEDLEIWKGGYSCPECNKVPDNNGEIHYFVKNKKVYHIKDSWIQDPKNDRALIPNEKLFKKLKKKYGFDKVYPIISNMKQGLDYEYPTGLDWDETHYCPVHGEFEVSTGNY